MIEMTDTTPCHEWHGISYVVGHAPADCPGPVMCDYAKAGSDHPAVPARGTVRDFKGIPRTSELGFDYPMTAECGTCGQPVTKTRAGWAWEHDAKAPPPKVRSWYIERSQAYPARHGYTGPIRSEAQARREQAAWRDAGWSAVMLPSTPEIRKAVREWQREADKRR